MPINENRIVPLLKVCDAYRFESSLESPCSPIGKPKIAERQVLKRHSPARFSTVKQFFITDTTNQLVKIESTEPKPIDKNMKSLRRQMTMNEGIESNNRFTSPEMLRFMLYDVDLSSNEDDMISSQNEYTQQSYNQATNNCVEEHMISVNNYNKEEMNMIRQQTKLKDDCNETVLSFSSLPSSPIIMIDNKETFDNNRKIWKPYFTGFSTVVIFTYFIISIIFNSILTGHVIQISPFNQMIGPSPETLIYIGARHVPCMKASKSYSTTEKIYPCPNSFINPDLIETNLLNQTEEISFDEENSCLLQTMCGGIKFKEADIPDQRYRFISASFLHSGMIQLFINVFAHIWLGLLVETRINSFRYGAIWFGSGIFGYIFGALFVPEGNVSVGCSASLMGVMGFLTIDLILNWKHIDHPYITVSKIAICFTITWIIGYLPGYDNFSHMGGFLAGLLITLIVMPLAKPQNNCDTKIRNYEQIVQFWLMRMMAIGFIVILLWMLLYLFSNNLSQVECYYCQYLSCITMNDMCTLSSQFMS